jgi:hypothetical protein
MHKAKILKIVMSSPVLDVARETGFEPTELMKFYLDLENLMKSDILYGEIGDKFCFLLALTTDDAKAELNIFNKDVFVPAIKAGILEKGNILLVNSSGEVIKQIEGIFINDYVQATEFSRDKQLIVLFIDYRAVHLIVNGTPKCYIPDILEYSHPGVTTPKTLSAREYRQLIDRHFKEAVHGEKGVKYWRNKEDRILLDNPESIFQAPLWLYLDQYIIDGTPDKEPTISGTANKSDIRITDWTNKTRYIVEIKCLGRTSLDSPEKSDEWANTGLSQINLYLSEEDKSCSVGTLVLYDGRKADKGINWDTKIECHPKYDNKPKRFYLESESASVKAKKAVSQHKKESRE